MDIIISPRKQKCVLFLYYYLKILNTKETFYIIAFFLNSNPVKRRVDVCSQFFEINCFIIIYYNNKSKSPRVFPKRTICFVDA